MSQKLTPSSLTAIEERDHAHFKSIPWCAEHLQSPIVTVFIPRSRSVKPSGEDNVFSRTLNTPETISNFMVFYEKPPSSSPAPERVDELKAFLTLGNGVDGWPGVVHGGIVATILDEMTGLLITPNIKANAIARADYMTAYLNTTFQGPVRTPGTILATARIIKTEGRKLFVEGRIWDEKSTPLAKADALFVALRTKF